VSLGLVVGGGPVRSSGLVGADGVRTGATQVGGVVRAEESSTRRCSYVLVSAIASSSVDVHARHLS
jgi:hypothetical protein